MAPTKEQFDRMFADLVAQMMEKETTMRNRNNLIRVGEKIINLDNVAEIRRTASDEVIFNFVDPEMVECIIAPPEADEVWKALCSWAVALD